MQSQTQTATISPAFAGYAAKYIRDVSDDLQRVFDNLLEIADGDVPDATGYDRLRATRILYDRGFGKVNKSVPQSPAPVPEPQPEPEPAQSEKSNNHSSDEPDQSRTEALDLKNAPPGGTTQLISGIQQKLDDILGTAQSPERSKPSAPAEVLEGFVPDFVRDSQRYVLQITDYGAKLADILMSIHEPDPDDTSIRQCHRVTAGQMMIDRVLGPAVSLQQDLDRDYDPAEDPQWVFRRPDEIDPNLTPEELKEADRRTRDLFEGMKQKDDSPCPDCEDDYLCEYHHPEGELREYANMTDEQVDIIARGISNLVANQDRLYFDPADGGLKLRPKDHVDDS